MSYRLERGESVISGLKRVIREEIESAGDHLSGEKKVTRDEAIHDARKSIKKVRAILRLVRVEMGEAFRKENTRLRDIAGRLSEFRDAFAIIETFDDLKNKFKEELTPAKLRSVRAGLTKRRNESGREEDVTVVLSAAAAALRSTAKRAKSWHFGADELYGAIAPGLETSYRNGRQALAKARTDPTPENLHELRKRVKDTWYHMRLLEAIWSDVMIAYEKSLKDLETWLGNDHNLAVLRDIIAAEPAFFGKEKDIALTLDLIARYQKELHGEALPLAERVYQEKPRDFTRRMKHLWDTWQSEPGLPGPPQDRTAA